MAWRAARGGARRRTPCQALAAPAHMLSSGHTLDRAVTTHITIHAGTRVAWTSAGRSLQPLCSLHQPLCSLRVLEGHEAPIDLV